MTSISESFSPYEFQREEFVSSIVVLANNAWADFNTNNSEWRKNYYGSLYDTEMAHRMVRLLAVRESWELPRTFVGFVVVLPLYRHLAKAHIAGSLNQYDFEVDWLDFGSEQEKTFHYIQSIYVSRRCLKSISVKRRLEASFRELLAIQKCGLSRREFMLYAEMGTRSGEALADRYGFEVAPNESFNEKPVRFFDSESEHGDLGQKTIQKVFELHNE